MILINFVDKLKQTIFLFMWALTKILFFFLKWLAHTNKPTPIKKKIVQSS